MISQQEYNEWFKEMLAKHPLKYDCILTSESYEETWYLNVTILHPKDEERNIIISTYGKELTLSIWKHHEHHDSFEDDNHEEEFKDLCEYIDDIINDKVFFAIAYNGEKIAYGTASYNYEDLLEEKVERVEVISWSSKKNK